MIPSRPRATPGLDMVQVEVGGAAAAVHPSTSLLQQPTPMPRSLAYHRVTLLIRPRGLILADHRGQDMAMDQATATATATAILHHCQCLLRRRMARPRIIGDHARRSLDSVMRCRRTRSLRKRPPRPLDPAPDQGRGRARMTLEHLYGDTAQQRHQQTQSQGQGRTTTVQSRSRT